MNCVYVDFGTLLQPNVLASSLLAYIPVFGKLVIIDMDYVGLLFASAGVVDGDRYETHANTDKWIDVYEHRLEKQISKSHQLTDPFASLALIRKGRECGYIEIIPPGDSLAEGWQELMPTLIMGRVKSVDELENPKLYSKWKVFLDSINPSIEYLVSKAMRTLPQPIQIGPFLGDSYIRGLYFAAESNMPVSTCNPVYWRWLKKNYECDSEIKLPDSQIARLVEVFSNKFKVDDVFRILDQRQICGALIEAKEEYDQNLITADSKTKAVLLFLIEEAVNLVASPVTSTINFFKMILKWKSHTWQRRP